MKEAAQNFDSLHTERLTIRPLTTADAAFHLKLMNTPKWHRYIGDRKVYSTEAAEEYVKSRIISQQKRLGFATYLVSLQSNSEPIGVCGFYDRPELEHIDFGFAFMPEYEGMGYAFEASQALLKYAQNKLSFEKLLAITIAPNQSSIRLLEKLGFVKQSSDMQSGSEHLLLYQLDLGTIDKS